MDSADLREGIWNHLNANVLSVAGRIYWGHTASAEMIKPFLVMMFRGDYPSVATPLGMFKKIEILCVGEEANILALDPVADEVIDAMHNQDITTPDGRVLRCEYRRDSYIDYWNEELRGNVILLSFLMPTDFWT